MRIPTPTIPYSTQQSGRLVAPTAAPMQDATGQQLQQVGQSLQSAGNAAARVGDALQDELDQGYLYKADAIASEKVRTTVGGFRQKAGEDAIKSFDGLHSQLRDELFNLRDSARSPAQRRSMDRLLAQRFQDATDSMVAHRDKAIRDHAIGGAEAARLGAINDYHGAVGNPAKMEEAKLLALSLSERLSQLRGDGPEEAKQSRLQTTTRLHLGAASALLTAGDSAGAEAYLEQARDEVLNLEWRQAKQTVRQAVLEDTARELTAQKPTLTDRLDWVAKNLKGEEAASVRRHLLYQEREEVEARSVEARNVRQQAEAWLNANPTLELRDNPALATRAAQLGVRPERTYVTNPEFAAKLQAMDAAGVERMKAMGEAQREQMLRPYLNDHDLKRWQAFFQDDQDIVSQQDAIKQAAVALGVIEQPDNRSLTRVEQIANAKRMQKFQSILQRNIDLLRAEKKENLTTREIQTEILDKMLVDKVWVDTFPDQEMSVVQAQIEGHMPIDDPRTDVDESAVADNGEWVIIDNQSHYLSEIPPAERIRIRREHAILAAKDGTSKFLSAKDEMALWLKKKAEREKRAAEQKAAQAPAGSAELPPGPMPVAGEEIPGAMDQVTGRRPK